MGKEKLEHRSYWQKKYRQEFDSAFADWFSQLRDIENPLDPRDQPFEVKQFRKGRLGEAMVPTLRAKAKQLLEQTDLGVKEAHAEYRKREAEIQGSFDWPQIRGVKEETLTKLRSATPAERAAMLQAARGSEDKNVRRAFRSALREFANEKHSATQSTEGRLVFDQLRRLARDWEIADEPADLTELRDLANEWANAGNALRREIHQKQFQIEPQQFLKPGIFDDLLGITHGQVVMHPKDGSLVSESEPDALLTT